MRVACWIGGALAAACLSSAAQACKCVHPIHPRGSYARADAVVLAMVDVIEVVDARTQTTKTWVSVEQAWKGKASGQLILITDGGCAVEMPEGQRYLLYLTRLSAQYYTTSRCSGTAPLAAAQRSLHWLNQHAP